MAEANPKSLPNDGGDPPKKKKNITSVTAAGGSKEVDRKAKKGDVEEVNFPNLHIMNEILSYKTVKGVTPSSDNPDTLREFCTPFIKEDFGNAMGWIRKIREIKDKFNSDSDPIDDVDKEEFELWKKIWGNEGKRDDDPGLGSSK